MRIACASCNAAYDVPPERVPPGKGVKCARCGTVWVPVERVDAEPAIEFVPEPERFVVAPSASPMPEPVFDPVPAPVSASTPDPVPTAAVPGHQPRRWPVLLGWVVTLLVLAALGWAAVHYRGAIVQLWPNAARAYGWAGLR